MTSLNVFQISFIRTLASSFLPYSCVTHTIIIVVVQLLSCVRLLAIPWSVAFQAPLSSTLFWSLLKFMSIESVVLTISSSVTPFSFCLQSFPTSESFPVSWLFALGGQSIEASALATVLPMNIQGWFPLGLTGLISLQSKGFSRVFSSTATQKHQSFSVQPPLWSNSHICTWLLEKL